MSIPPARLALLGGTALLAASVPGAPLAQETVPPTRRIVFGEIPALCVETPPRSVTSEEDEVWLWRDEDRGRALAFGSSLVAIPVEKDAPRCVFGLPSDDPGSIWFLGATGVDPVCHRPGPEHGEYSRYGDTLELAGDHDGDEVPDLLVSAPGSLEDPGKIFLVSTAAREVLSVLSSPKSRMRFGTAICAIADQDGDGVEDVAVFAEEPASGERQDAFVSVHVCSTATGERLSTPVAWIGAGAYDHPQLAWIPLDGAGDSSGLLLVGIHSAKPGRLIAVELPGGDHAWTLNAEEPGEEIAWSLDTTADLDGDGVREVLSGDIGSGDSRSAGRVRVVSGRTGEILRSSTGIWANSSTGYSVAGYDDIDGDGVDDHLVTTREPLFDGGSVLVLSGADGTAVKRLTLSGGVWSLGWALEAGADWNGEGARDLCFSCYVPQAGAASLGVFTVEDGRFLHHVDVPDVEALIWQREEPPPDAPPDPSDQRGRAVAISGDGVLIACGFTCGSVALFEAKSGERLRDLEPPLESVPWQLSFSPDATRLAGLGQRGELLIWELEGPAESEHGTSPAKRGRALRPGGSIGGGHFGARLSWSPDGERLVVLDHRGLASLWTAIGERVLRWKSAVTPPGHPQANWTPDGRTLLRVDGPHVQQRDGRTGALRPGDERFPEIRGPSPVVSMDLHPDGVLLATGHEDCRVKLWNVESGRLAGATQFSGGWVLEEDDDIGDLAFSPSGDRLALSTRDGTHIVVADSRSLRDIWVSGFLGAHFFEVYRISWSPDGSRLWYAFECGSATLFSVDPKPGAQAEEHGDGLVPLFGGETGVVLSPGEAHAIDLSGLRLW